MPTFTTNYNLALPLVNNATDQDLWGGYLNTDLSSIDTLLKSGITNAVQSSQTSSFSASASISIRYLYPCDATSGSITATLPAAATAGNGATIIFQKTDSTSNAVTLSRSGSDTINGATTYSVTNRYDILAAVSDGVSAWLLMVKPPVAPIVYPTISGFIPSSISGTSTTASLTISSGFASDKTRVAGLGGSGFSWSVTNGNAANGYAGGTTLPNSSTIHFYVMATSSDTTWSASFASTSITPTLPGSYVYYRRIFSLLTNGSGALINVATNEINGGGLMSYFSTAGSLDVNVSNLGTTRTLYTLSVPSGVKVLPMIRCRDGGPNPSVISITSPDEADAAPNPSTAPLADAFNHGDTQQGTAVNVLTNTSAQVYARSDTANTTLFLYTRGWIDFRTAS